ncbi:MAG: YceI family protein [Chloroflexota bacterium]|nr:YceI family protein [Chloroflexota bacterium]PLS77915.1 MAG: polyisoprenoid-binding protein [Chloroflexota bacterium]
MQWHIDAAHSAIDFSVRHMMISTVRGSFAKFGGVVNLDEADPTRSSVEVQIDAASIDTRDAQRDAHLRGPDFFDVETYPYLTFKSTRIERVDETRAKIFGDLTIRNVTREVVLDAEYNGQAKSPWGTTSAGFEAQTKISRKEWGLTWNAALETGGVLVGDEIKISIQIEVVQQPEEAEELAEQQAAAS